MNVALLALLVLSSIPDSQNQAEFLRNPSGIVYDAVSPETGETFFPTKAWIAVEEIAWGLAEAEDLPIQSRLVWFSMIWNESRGRSKTMGDHGCARGLGQLHVGGTGDDGRRCVTDLRQVLKGEIRTYKPERFLEPKTNLAASLQVFLLKGGKEDPYTAAANYAGFYSSYCPAKLKRKCKVGEFLGKLRYWLDTGLAARVLERQAREARSFNGPGEEEKDARASLLP